MTVPNEQDIRRHRQAPPATQEEAADVGALQAALAAAESRALESRDLYMRALAELENVRKRAVPRRRAGAQVRARARSPTI